MILTIFIIIALFVGALIGASFYMLNFSLKPSSGSRNLEESMRYMKEEYPQIVPWIDSLQQSHALRDTTIVAADGALLHGYFVAAPEPTDKTAVLVHGYTDNAIRMMMIGYLYNHDLGYNILLPDLRNPGLSDGDHDQMG